MKKIIILSMGAAILLCGCTNQNDAKIEALTQKVDTLAQTERQISSNQGVIISNQATIFNELEAVRSQVTNLPDLFQIDRLAYFYHTNEMQRLNAFWDWDYRAATNQTETTKGVGQLVVRGLGNIIKTARGDDVVETAKMMEMEDNVEQIQQDMDKIKRKLSIYY